MTVLLLAISLIALKFLLLQGLNCNSKVAPDLSPLPNGQAGFDQNHEQKSISLFQRACPEFSGGNQRGISHQKLVGIFYPHFVVL